MPMPVASDRVMVLEVLNKVAFTSSTSTWTWYELGDPVKNVGPLLDAIQAYALGQNFVLDFEYQIIGQASYDLVTWSDFSVSLIAAQSAEGNKFGTPNTAQADFGPHIRFRIGVRSTTGNNVSGTISAKIALRFLAA